MRRPTAYLTVEAVRLIQTEVLAVHGGQPGLRDAALLESAVAAPQATMGGRELLPDLIDIAAAYLFYLCRNHPFVDGNKRTALASCLTFLSENGLLPNEGLEVDAWEQLTVAVAESRLGRKETALQVKELLRSN